MEKILAKVYYDLNKQSSAYSSAEKIYTEAKKIDPRITRKIVENWLIAQPTYTIFKQALKRFPRIKSWSPGLHTTYQCDLCIFDGIKSSNYNYPYLLVCIDVLSRKIFVAPAKSKASNDMKKAFDKIWTKSGYKPWKLFSDRGVEFTAKEMKEYFEKNNIIKYGLAGHYFHGVGMVERANRTIKQRLYKYFHKKKTVRWFNVIDSIVESINNSVNRSTGVSPNSVTFENAQELYKRLYKDSLPNRKPKYKVGDTVRISLQKEVFRKGYTEQFTEQIFRIISVLTTNPPTYELQTLGGYNLDGIAYEQQLTRAKV